MNTLLLFFALPIATIILAIVLEKILRSPILVAATFFAIYLIVAFAFFDATFLIFAIVYTILAFIAAVIADFFFRRARNWNDRCNRNNLGIENNNNNSNCNNQNNNSESNCGCNNGNSNNSNNNCSCNQPEVVTANLTNNTTGNRSTWCCYRR